MAKPMASLIPNNVPSDLAMLKRRQSPSIDSINKKEDKGKPYLIPRPLLKNDVGDPLTKTVNEAVEIQDIIL